MKPSDFKEQTQVLHGPPDTLRTLIIPLPVYKGMDNSGTPLIISRWVPTEQEIKDIQDGKPLWLICMSRYHPPVALTTEYPFDPINPEPKCKCRKSAEGFVDLHDDDCPEFFPGGLVRK